MISDGVLGATILVTVGAMWYLSRKIRLVKPDVIYARRKARQGKVANTGFSPYAGGGPTEAQNSNVFNPNASDTSVPLNPAGYQQWDASGRAVGYAQDPRLNVYQPEPHRAHQQPLAFREDSGGTGTTYPRGLTDGRSPVRQESSDSGHSGTPPQRRETFELPRVASPEAGAGDYDNPFEQHTAYISAPSFPASGPHPPSYPTTQTHPPYGAGANLSSQPPVRASVLPNPFGDEASEEHHASAGHVHQATDSSYAANDGHSYPDQSLR